MKQLFKKRDGHIYAIIGILILVIGIVVISQTSNYTMAKKTNSSAEAIFAGGCFWCMESDFEKIDGVKEVVSGYTGGAVKNPTYKDVSSGTTGHREAIKIVYDPQKITYKELLEHFWVNIDPFNDEGQFCDTGFQYTAAIYYQTKTEKKLAEQSKEAVANILHEDVVTAIEEAGEFYDAEDYHQDYYLNHKLKYKTYRFLCGRDQRLRLIWHEREYNLFDNPESDYHNYTKPSDEELKEMLTAIQYKVTQKDGTERPFQNDYHDSKDEGIYVDILSGEPLFSSTDKYDSGTGWPSFTKPLEPENIVEKTDYKLIYPRTEVRSKYADSHIGHVFKDGPAPTGLRYCMNSAALRFVPKEDMKKEGYEDYLYLFD